MATVLVFAACGPERLPAFAGRYLGDFDNMVCGFDDPRAPNFVVSFGPNEIEILEDDGVFSFDVPAPPWPMEGLRDDDVLALRAADCVVEDDQHGVRDPVGTRYSSIVGVAFWSGDLLEIEIELQRQFPDIPEGLPSWWDDPASCCASYSLRTTK